jgi:hypothetical protein
MTAIIHAISKSLPGRVLAVLALGLGIAALCAQSALYDRLKSSLEDAQQRLLAKPLAFEHVLVFDVDEESMQRLDAGLGAWPYPRDVFARASAFLSARGARAVVYDILFSEARAGDEAQRSGSGGIAAGTAPRSRLSRATQRGSSTPRRRASEILAGPYAAPAALYARIGRARRGHQRSSGR